MSDYYASLRDGDLTLSARIQRAIHRVTHGEASMRIPAEATDPDLVLQACADRITSLEAQLADAQEALTLANSDRATAWAECAALRAERDAALADAERRSERRRR